MQLRLILTLIALVLSSGTQAQSRGDDVIVEMSKAFAKNDAPRLAALLPQARGHVLEPWAAYWALKARLDEASPQAVQDFLTRYAGTYQEDRLRNDWLLLLGQRRDWEAFAAEYPKFRMNDDREVRCYALAVAHLRGDADGAAEVLRNWHDQRNGDDGCTFAADRFFADRKIAEIDIWRKARLAVEANRPKLAREVVTIVSPEALPLLAELNDKPTKFLTTKFSAVRKVRKELVLLAVIKLATSDPDAAAQLLENKWGFQLTAEERNWGWGVIGKQATTRLSPLAVDYFSRVQRNADLTDDMLAWKVRAALRLGRWATVTAAVDAMSDKAQDDPAWVYWKARARMAAMAPADRAAVAAPPTPPASPTPAAVPASTAMPAAASSAPTTTAGAVAAARPVASAATPSASAPPPAPSPKPEVLQVRQWLESIASGRGFYEQLALEELGQRVTVPPRPAPPTAQEMEAMQRNPGLVRALAAIALGVRPEGVREWNYHTNLHTRGGMNDRELLAAAELACQHQVWDRCINTSERTKAFTDVSQRFPMPFRDAVLQRSREIGLDPAYVYGLIRQESRFVMDARSGVGASGLMQVMPATARWTARKIGMTGFTTSQLTDRDTNIAIGTGYLKLVLDDFEGSMALAAAAYNAGPSRPRAWRNGPLMETAIWAENVPFSETRDYVKKVLANTTSYAALISGQPQSLKARLGSVGPRDGSLPAPSTELP
ncbi:MAG: transglycosylase SLT domain-containing protein [Burkholderiales bacterium]|nr:transglycosylase SLT domain-containing protein [Burkholderiales bacterium]